MDIRRAYQRGIRLQLPPEEWAGIKWKRFKSKAGSSV